VNERSGKIPKWPLSLVNHMPGPIASLILIGANIAAAIGASLFGEISQHVGRKKVLLWSGVLRVITFPILFLAMANTTDLTIITVCALSLSFIANGSYGPILIFLNERFPTDVRASGTGLSWNIGFALGGMMPALVSLFAVGAQQLPIILAIFTTVFSVLYVIGSLIIPETQGNLDRDAYS
jgi:MHS family proline/betaine transporter-like MFS transporter